VPPTRKAFGSSPTTIYTASPRQIEDANHHCSAVGAARPDIFLLKDGWRLRICVPPEADKSCAIACALSHMSGYWLRERSFLGIETRMLAGVKKRGWPQSGASSLASEDGDQFVAGCLKDEVGCAAHQGAITTRWLILLYEDGGISDMMKTSARSECTSWFSSVQAIRRLRRSGQSSAFCQV